METENRVRNKTPSTALILIYFSEVHIPIYCKNSSASFSLEHKPLIQPSFKSECWSPYQKVGLPSNLSWLHWSGRPCASSQVSLQAGKPRGSFCPYHMSLAVIGMTFGSGRFLGTGPFVTNDNP